MKLKTEEEADINITALIDCLMQCIIFFMVIMSAQYLFGVAVKFPGAGGPAKGNKDQPQEKKVVIYVSPDQVTTGHKQIYEGILKIGDKPIVLSVTPPNGDTTKWEAERKRGYDELEYEISKRLKEGYKKDVVLIQGEMLTYHGKILRVIDRAKAQGMEGFSLVPPGSRQ